MMLVMIYYIECGFLYNVYIYFFGLSKCPMNSWTIWIIRGNKCSKENHSLVKCFGYIVFHTPRFTVKGSNAWIEDQESMQRIWSSVKTPMFSLDDREKQLGLGSKGVSTYFTPNCNQDDAELVNRFFKDIDMEGMKNFANKYFL